MNKRIAFVTLSLLVLGPAAFAEQDHDRRGVLNKVTDWTVTTGKPAEERKRILDERIEWRAERRKLEAEYQDRLVAIHNENISAEEMAQKLKDAQQDHKEAVRQMEAKPVIP